MTPELVYLAYSVILLIVHALLQATFSDLSKGLGWALGPRDDPREGNVFAARLEKSLRNYLETYPAFIALALALAVTETGNATSALGAAIWFWARIGYIAAYVSGIPLVRSLVWFASIAGLLLMLVPLFGPFPEPGLVLPAQ